MTTQTLVILIAAAYAVVAFVSSAVFSTAPGVKTASALEIMVLGLIWPAVYVVALWFALVDFFERRQRRAP